jgi:hypothetical protein
VNKTGHGKFFEGLNFAGAILFFAAFLGIVIGSSRLAAQYPYLLYLGFMAYFIGQFVLIIAQVGLSEIRFTLSNVFALMVLYTLLAFWDCIAILLSLPFIIITMLLGPFMVMVFVLAIVILGVYCVEEVIGYDIQGIVSAIETGYQAAITSISLLVSFSVLSWHFMREDGEDWVMERAGDLIFRLRLRLQGMVEKIIRDNRA